MREYCEELFLTFLCSFKICLPGAKHQIGKEGRSHPSCYRPCNNSLSAYVVFNDIRDRMDRQDAIIASLREERPRRAPNARRQGRRVRLDDSNDYHEDEFEDEDDQASLNNEGRFAPRGERCGRGF